MIASLRGEVLSIALNHAVIDCAGVGYQFLATPSTLATLVRGEAAQVLTTMVVKEDSVTLYGFTSDNDRQMFHTLQTVSGLGPKLAVAALSVFSAGDLAVAIAAGETKTLQTIPGVGKRMAERLALELKDKVAAFAPEASASADAADVATAPAGGAVVEQVTEALVGLGFTEKSARPVVEAIVAEEPAAPMPAILKLALAQLGKTR